VLAEGTGQEYVAQNMHAVDEGDASGNRLLLDVGLWLTQKVKVGSKSCHLSYLKFFYFTE
jgi:hypothetical protein